MKIAFATDDRITIAQRTGRAKEFAVYELSAYEVINVVYHSNEHVHHDHTGGEHKGHSHKEIAEKIKGVDYVYLKHLGTHLKKDFDDLGIKYEFTKENSIKTVLDDFFEEESA